MKIKNIFIMIFTTLFLFACGGGGGGGGDKGDGDGNDDGNNIISYIGNGFQIDEYASELPGTLFAERISRTAAVSTDDSSGSTVSTLYTFKNDEWSMAQQADGSAVQGYSIERISDNDVIVSDVNITTLYHYDGSHWDIVKDNEEDISSESIKRISDTAVVVTKIVNAALVGYLYHYENKQWSIAKLNGADIKGNISLISDTAVIVYNEVYDPNYEYLYYYKNNGWHVTDGGVMVYDSQIIANEGNDTYSLWSDDNGGWQKKITFPGLTGYELTGVLSENTIIVYKYDNGNSTDKLLTRSNSNEAWAQPNDKNGNPVEAQFLRRISDIALYVSENYTGAIYYYKENGWIKLSTSGMVLTPYAETLIMVYDQIANTLYYYDGSDWKVAQAEGTDIKGRYINYISANTVYADGGNGIFTMFFYDGSNWNKLEEYDEILTISTDAVIVKNGSYVELLEYKNNEWKAIRDYTSVPVQNSNSQSTAIIENGKTYLIYPKAD